MVVNDAGVTSGTALLQKYLKRSGQKPADIARATGIDPSLLSRWVRGLPGRRPGLEHACELERITNGAVPACSWLKNSGKTKAA